MRIAHVIDSMEIGGAEIMVQSLCRTHRAQGHEVSVHCLYACGTLGEKLREEGIPVTIYGPGQYWVLIARMCGAFRKVTPDVVHSHNVVASVVGAVAGRFGGARVVICTRHGIVSKTRNLRRQGLFWLAARCADRVVAVCAKAQHNLARATFAQPSKLVTIWNGAAPAPTSEGGAPEPDTPTFTVITVARLGPPKDHATLVRAIANARERVQGLRLWIVGDGPNAAAIRQLAAELGCAEAVHLLGSRSDVGDWLARADLFALSSLSEGVPIALLEAMAASLPSVVSDVGGMGEVVNGGKAGTVVPAGDVDGFTASIVRYAGDRERLREHGVNARGAYLRHFTLERMADGYMTLYRNPRAAIQPHFGSMETAR